MGLGLALVPKKVAAPQTRISYIWTSSHQSIDVETGD